MAPRRAPPSPLSQQRIQLPEELLREILAYDLVMSPDIFAGPYFSAGRNGQLTLLETMSKKTSPSNSQRSQPVDILLVCKQFLRVATPLLYEAITIRCASQMQSLAAALHVSPELGKLIKRLSATDGFGAEFLRVTTCTPNLHTVGLTIDIGSSRSVKGLITALPSLNPKCFLFMSRYYPENRNVETVRDALERAIPRWHSLVRGCLWLYSFC